MKTINLRGHHLLCMLNWKGVGYTPAFTANYNRIIDELKTSAVRIKIVAGKDDICAPLTPETYDGYHCDDSEILTRDQAALDDINAQLNLSLCVSSEFELSEYYLNTMREKFQAGTVRAACAACSWHDFCSDIAADNFKDTKL